MKRIYFLIPIMFLFGPTNYLFPQFKNDTLYSKPVQPTHSTQLFGIDLSNQDIYKSFETMSNKDGKVIYYTKAVSVFDYVYTEDEGIHYIFENKRPDDKLLELVVDMCEINFGKETKNFDIISNLKLNGVSWSSLIKIVKAKIHRVYEDDKYVCALLWEDNNFTLLVKPLK